MDQPQDTSIEFALDVLLDGDALPRSEPSDCPYLPGETTQSEGFYLTDRMDRELYRGLMDRGFRRSGRVFYRPRCPDCSKCVSYRVPVDAFRPSRNMRRVWNRNADLRAEVGPLEATGEKHELYSRYLDAHHDGTMTGTREEFERFLYDEATASGEFRYYLGTRLIGVSIADFCTDAVSTVYMFFDPDEAWRSLGTYSILWEIDYCRRAGLSYYYLGYYVPGSRTMAYKARFKPGEYLHPDGTWSQKCPQDE